MALRINTNVAALSAHKNMIKNDNSLSASLEKLSSGLRINKAADDASGMAIADSLRSQGLGLGQAVRNANDGISMVQTADGALEESINIVNTIKTKSIQAAQDGQTIDSRKAIQADINKLMQELDVIAKTTSFNGQKLLSGAFTDKKFQVGAYSGETVGVSIGSSESTKTGHLSTAILKSDAVNGGEVRMTIQSSLQATSVALQSVTLAYDNEAQHGIGALADAINKVAAVTGVTAQLDVSVSSTGAVGAGTTGSDFAVNGIAIGAVEIFANDSNGALVNSINQKSDQHGVTASVDAGGVLTLTATDGRAIQVTGSTSTVLAGSNLSTFGQIKLFQIGANEIKINDEAQVMSLNVTANVTASDKVTTSVDSVLSKDSVIASLSVLKAGTTLGFDAGAAQMIDADISTTQDTILTAGSVLGSGTTIESGSILGGSVSNQSAVTTTDESVLKTGSILGSTSVLAAGTVVTTQFIDSAANTYTAGTTLSSDVTISDAVTLTADMNIAAGSVFNDDENVFTAGSYIGADVVVSGNATMTLGMTLKANSIIGGSASTIKAGSTLGGDLTTSGADITVLADTQLKAGSVIGSNSAFAKGSTIGGNVTTSANVTTSGEMTLAAGSQLQAASTIKAGTVLTNDVWVAGGDLLKAGTVLQGDAITSGTNYLNNSMTLKSGSVMASGSVFAAAQTAATGASATTSLSDIEKFTLADVDVTSQEGAQVAISIADSALKNLDKIRSDLGSVQNQLTSTIANISVTRVNIFAAESSIRDVDFAEESANFSRMQILSQASTFAMAQANASSQNVLSLLQ
ncbi:MAG: flagellar protein FlaB [Proteobacteria bacterium]|nr:flagellar protein FlaB [Pseudomonadota bacterium]MBU4296704.1 flagellar protein FlaB [Pseudomonadota bacterium]MCG2748497.1 flagellar protein FlaB [Desulfobulbaceae bacterium]